MKVPGTYFTWIRRLLHRLAFDRAERPVGMVVDAPGQQRSSSIGTQTCARAMARARRNDGVQGMIHGVMRQ